MSRSLPQLVAAAIALGSGATVAAQVPRPGPPAPPAGYYQRAAPTAPVAQGTVSRYLLNPNGEVDGLLLADGTQVNFPPHMSDELVATIKPGQSVSVQGIRESAASVSAFVISNGSSSVVEHEPVGPPAPPPGRQGTVQQLLYGPRGEVNGLVLSDSSIVRFPPQTMYQIGNLLHVGQPLSVAGYGTANQYGKALQATAIGARGQPLQTLYGPAGPAGPGLAPLPPRPPRRRAP